MVEPSHGGIAIYSRLPLKQGEVRYLESIKRPRVYARAKVNHQWVTLLFVHPVIPIVTYKFRNDDLAQFAKEAAAAGEPVVVFGDLNCTPWSHYFDLLKRDGKLRDTMGGFGIQPTWNAFWGLPILPIDHCLASEELTTIERRIGPKVGADHLPVFVELALENNAK